MGEYDGVLQKRKHCVKERGTKSKVSRKEAEIERTIGETNKCKTSQEIKTELVKRKHMGGIRTK